MSYSNKIIGKIAENGYTRKEIAELLNISTWSFRKKLKTGIFNNDEIIKLTKILKIENPFEFFFSDFINDYKLSNK